QHSGRMLTLQFFGRLKSENVLMQLVKPVGSCAGCGMMTHPKCTDGPELGDPDRVGKASSGLDVAEREESVVAQLALDVSQTVPNRFYLVEYFPVPTERAKGLGQLDPVSSAALGP